MEATGTTNSDPKIRRWLDVREELHQEWIQLNQNIMEARRDEDSETLQTLGVRRNEIIIADQEAKMKLGELGVSYIADPKEKR